jgi:hypothetical protein
MDRRASRFLSLGIDRKVRVDDDRSAEGETCGAFELGSVPAGFGSRRDDAFAAIRAGLSA